MKILKSALTSVIISVLVIVIEPIRIFAGLASFVILGMLIVDSVKCYIKAQKISVKEKKR